VGRLDWIFKWLWPKKPTVVLIAGIGGFHKRFLQLGKTIENWGFRVIYPGSISYSAEKIVEIAEEIEGLILKENKNNLYLIGHSKGGLVARYLIYKYPEIEKITKKVITIASPHKGTVFGLVPIKGLEEMKIGGSFIKEIEGKNLDKVVNFYPKLDETIIPNGNLIIKGAENQMIAVIGHEKILESQELVNRLKILIR
jgi:triacylglycerol lipase